MITIPLKIQKQAFFVISFNQNSPPQYVSLPQDVLSLMPRIIQTQVILDLPQAMTGWRKERGTVISSSLSLCFLLLVLLLSHSSPTVQGLQGADSRSNSGTSTACVLKNNNNVLLVTELHLYVFFISVQCSVLHIVISSGITTRAAKVTLANGPWRPANVGEGGGSGVAIGRSLS